MFDSALTPSAQIEEIEIWIERIRQSVQIRDFILFYSGHGGFTRNDQAYYLATRSTREGAEGATSIRYSDLANSIKRQTRGIRRYLILDCCFAAAAVGIQASVGSLLVRKVEEELPPEGTAVLCSSSSQNFSKSPPGEKYTMFSGALIECLNTGIAGHHGDISLEDLGDRVRQLIQTKFPLEGVRPELHVPDQEWGNPAKVGLFANRAYSGVKQTDTEPYTLECADYSNNVVPPQRRLGMITSYHIVMAASVAFGVVALVALMVMHSAPKVTGTTENPEQTSTVAGISPSSVVPSQPSTGPSIVESLPQFLAEIRANNNDAKKRSEVQVRARQSQISSLNFGQISFSKKYNTLTHASSAKFLSYNPVANTLSFAFSHLLTNTLDPNPMIDYDATVTLLLGSVSNISQVDMAADNSFYLTCNHAQRCIDVAVTRGVCHYECPKGEFAFYADSAFLEQIKALHQGLSAIILQIDAPV